MGLVEIVTSGGEAVFTDTKVSANTTNLTKYSNHIRLA